MPISAKTGMANLQPADRIRSHKYLANFIQAPRFRLWTEAQQHWLLPVVFDLSTAAALSF